MKVIKGLLCVAMGCMMSCSNILEDGGVAPTSQNGSLVLSVEQDPTIKVTTKGTDVLPEADGTFTVNITGNSQSDVTKRYSEIQGQMIPLKAGTYTLSAYNIAKSEIPDFAWDKPCYFGSKNTTITANKTQPEELTCTLANSKLVVDTKGLTSTVVKVKSMFVKNGGKQLDLTQKPQEGEGVVYVKAGIPAVVELTLERVSDNVQLETIKTPLVKQDPDATGNTEAAKEYKLIYTLGTNNGGGKFTIKVDNGVEPVEVPMEVNPY